MTRDAERNKDSTRCCRSFNDEFRKHKFSLIHEDPSKFCCSQWQRGDRSVIWLLYRWLLAASFAGGVIASAVIQWTEGLYFIYMTNWGFTMCWITCTYGAILATIYFINPKYFAPGSWSLRIFWAAHFTTTVLALLITLIFWAALFPVMPEVDNQLFNIWSHAFNSILMVFDCFMVAFPSQIMHFIYPFGIGIIYFIFSICYYLAGGVDPFGYRYIYYILDWTSPGLAIGTACGCMLLIFLLCILVFWIYRLRMRIYNSCKTKEVQ